MCGLAELLLAAGLPYDSPDSRQLAQEVLAFVNYTSKLASVELTVPPTGRSAPVVGASTGAVNLPGTARAIEVYDTYLSAWEAGCKGITVYVDGSRQIQPKAL